MVGGTGPTGPHIVGGLLERGYDVTVFHRGTHEVAELPPVRHIHGDPHFLETIQAAAGNGRYELVVAAYGRTRLLAQAFAGRCDRFFAIGGVAAYRGSLSPDPLLPAGMTILADEDGLKNEPGTASEYHFGERVREAELRTFELHRRGAFDATYFRYPSIYGPRQTAPSEWSVIRRIRDGRPFMILPDRGLLVFSRAAARNAAHAVLAAVDQPAKAAGRVYNCSDHEVLSLHQWMWTIADLMGARLEMVSLPFELATMAHGLARCPSHVIVDSNRLRDELGYRDIVSFREGMAETIAWYEEHPVTKEEYPWLTDPFDYQHEDALVDAYQRAWTSLEARAGPVPEFVHPYAHPRKAGHQRDHQNR